MVLTFRRGRFSLRGQRRSRSFYIHPSTPLQLSSCSWEKKNEGWKQTKGGMKRYYKKTESRWGWRNWQTMCVCVGTRQTKTCTHTHTLSPCIHLYSHKRAEFHWLNGQTWMCVYFYSYCIHWSLVCVCVCAWVCVWPSTAKCWHEV